MPHAKFRVNPTPFGNLARPKALRTHRAHQAARPGPKTKNVFWEPHISVSRCLTPSFVSIRPRLVGFSKIMIPQNFNVYSCHYANCSECIYRGGVGVERPCPDKVGRQAKKWRFNVQETKASPPCRIRSSSNDLVSCTTTRVDCPNVAHGQAKARPWPSQGMPKLGQGRPRHAKTRPRHTHGQAKGLPRHGQGKPKACQGAHGQAKTRPRHAKLGQGMPTWVPSKIMILQKFNVCSCHFAKCSECIYRGACGLRASINSGRRLLVVA